MVTSTEMKDPDRNNGTREEGRTCTAYIRLRASIELLEDVQPVQDHLLARLLDFARQEDLVQNRVHLVKVEHEVLRFFFARTELALVEGGVRKRGEGGGGTPHERPSGVGTRWERRTGRVERTSSHTLPKN